MIVFLDNMCFTLASKLEKESRVLNLIASDRDMLCDLLGDDGHSYLTVANSTQSEIIRVSCTEGCGISIVRGQGGTTPITVPSQNCACFKVNQPVFNDALAQGGTDDVCLPKVVIAEGQEDYMEIIPPEAGDCDYTLKLTDDFVKLLCDIEECCEDKACSDCKLSNGTYENATVVVRNGQICGITQGRNIVYTGGSCCTCNNCDENSTGNNGGPETTVQVLDNQNPNEVEVFLTSESTCGGLTSSSWQVRDGANNLVLEGDDASGMIEIDLSNSTGPFTMTSTVLDDCGSSTDTETFTVAGIPVASVTADDDQNSAAVIIALNTSSSCGDITSGIWEVRDDGGVVVENGDNIGGSLNLNLSAYTGPFTVSYTVTDACGTSETSTDTFTTVSSNPSASITINSAEGVTPVLVTLGGVPSMVCPIQSVDSATWEVLNDANEVVESGSDLPSDIEIDTSSFDVGEYTITYTITDFCGTSNQASQNFEVV